MKLVVLIGWQGVEQLISNNADKNSIAELIDSLDWNQFNIVRLEKDDQNWIEVSGNIKPDGFAVVYEEEGVSSVSKNAPESVKQFTKLLQSYACGDNQYKKYGFNSPSDPTPNKVSTKNYELWKIQYNAKKTIEKRNSRLAIIASIAITAFIVSILYLLYTDELKFIGRQTEYTEAAIIEIKLRPVRGGYIQIVTYQFNIQGKKFKGYFKGTKLTGKQKINDLVRVKFVISNPEISKRIASLKKVNSN